MGRSMLKLCPMAPRPQGQSPTLSHPQERPREPGSCAAEAGEVCRATNSIPGKPFSEAEVSDESLSGAEAASRVCLSAAQGVSPLLSTLGTRLVLPNRWGWERPRPPRGVPPHPSPRGGDGRKSAGGGHSLGSQTSEWDVGVLGVGGHGHMHTNTQPTHGPRHTETDTGSRYTR